MRLRLRGWCATPTTGETDVQLCMSRPPARAYFKRTDHRHCSEAGLTVNVSVAGLRASVAKRSVSSRFTLRIGYVCASAIGCAGYVVFSNPVSAGPQCSETHQHSRWGAGVMRSTKPLEAHDVHTSIHSCRYRLHPSQNRLTVPSFMARPGPCDRPLVAALLPRCSYRTKPLSDTCVALGTMAMSAGPVW
jgi:hypothetical protein